MSAVTGLYELVFLLPEIIHEATEELAPKGLLNPELQKYNSTQQL